MTNAKPLATGMMAIACVCAVAAVSAAVSGDQSSETISHPFAPGWNGEARTPPLGWRSWNAFGNKINQRMMEKAMEALTVKNRTIFGKAGTSLCEAAGFCSVGVDEGWEACGVGVNGTQHAADGTPTINTTRFPDMRKMVDYGHHLGLKVGWYENGCKCAEKKDNAFNYAGDVKSLTAFGFDGIKLDGAPRGPLHGGRSTRAAPRGGRRSFLY